MNIEFISLGSFESILRERTLAWLLTPRKPRLSGKCSLLSCATRWRCGTHSLQSHPQAVGMWWSRTSGNKSTSTVSRDDKGVIYFVCRVRVAWVFALILIKILFSFYLREIYLLVHPPTSHCKYVHQSGT